MTEEVKKEPQKTKLPGLPPRWLRLFMRFSFLL